MPILPYETDVYPPELLEEQLTEAAEAEETASWWVMYTISRREKDLMRRLRNLEVPYYGPLIRRKYRSPGGRSRVSYAPLFPSYVFVRATQQQRQTALTTNCISRTLEVPDGDQLVHDLRQIRRLIDADVPLTPESRIQPGQLVRVKSGPLMGVEGVVLKRHSGDRLLVSVQFLQQGASVSLEDYQVEVR